MTNEEILLNCFNESLLKEFPLLRGRTKKMYTNMQREYDNRIKSRDEENVPQYTKSYRKMSKMIRAQYDRVSSVSDIGIPQKENEQFRFITTKQFNAVVFLLYFIEQIGEIDEAVITVYRIGLKTVEVIDMLLKEGKIKKLIIQLSTMRLTAKEHKVKEMLEAMIKKHGRDKIWVSFAWNHTKIMCFKIGSEHYVMEGSGNLSDNARVEQYLIEKSKESYEFHKKWVLDIKSFSATKDVVIL